MNTNDNKVYNINIISSYIQQCNLYFNSKIFILNCNYISAIINYNYYLYLKIYINKYLHNKYTFMYIYINYKVSIAYNDMINCI